MFILPHGGKLTSPVYSPIWTLVMLALFVLAEASSKGGLLLCIPKVRLLRHTLSPLLIPMTRKQFPTVSDPWAWEQG